MAEPTEFKDVVEPASFTDLVVPEDGFGLSPADREPDDDDGLDDVEEIERAPVPNKWATPRTVKTSLRKVEGKPSYATGERPWWASDDPQVWQQNQQRMHVRDKSDNQNLIDWKGVGTNTGVRY